MTDQLNNASAKELHLAIGEYEKAASTLLSVNPEVAFSKITGAFVFLACKFAESNGHNPNVEICIDGGEYRNITIHESKNLSSLMALASQRLN